MGIYIKCIPYGYAKFLGDFTIFKPDGTASPIKAISLEDYDFEAAVRFFSDREKIRNNELLRRFESGPVRERYRQQLASGEITAEQLKDKIEEEKRNIVSAIYKGHYGEEPDITKEALSKSEAKTEPDIIDELIHNLDTESIGFIKKGYDKVVKNPDGTETVTHVMDRLDIEKLAEEYSIEKQTLIILHQHTGLTAPIFNTS